MKRLLFRRGFCTRCGTRLVRGARFCNACGHDSRPRPDPSANEERRASRRTVLAIAATFGGVFVALVVGGVAYALELPFLAQVLLFNLALVGAGGLGVLALGEGSWDASLAGRSDGRGVWLGLGGGVVGFVLNLAYALVLMTAAPGEPEHLEALPPPGILWIGMALMPAAVEEWLCRGVLWRSCRRAISPQATLWLTAALFAFLHMLNGSGWFEVPHRFVFGLILGWLRLRTGSLVPCFLAHLLNNTLAVFLFSQA